MCLPTSSPSLSILFYFVRLDGGAETSAASSMSNGNVDDVSCAAAVAVVGALLPVD
jgi:hypothetical protein